MSVNALHSLPSAIIKNGEIASSLEGKFFNLHKKEICNNISQKLSAYYSEHPNEFEKLK